jgi:hypothetical protein
MYIPSMYKSFQINNKSHWLKHWRNVLRKKIYFQFDPVLVDVTNVWLEESYLLDDLRFVPRLDYLIRLALAK